MSSARESRTVFYQNYSSRPGLDLSVVIRSGRSKSNLVRCLSSIDEQVEVVASVANDVDFIDDLVGMKVAPHRYGNWSVAAESGIKQATFNDVIVMDGDSVFAPGAVGEINKSLKTGSWVVQPTVIFLHTGSLTSKLVSKSRTHENRHEVKSYSPGLGLKRKELLGTIGINGNIFNPQVEFGDDGYLDQRIKDAGISISLCEKAIIYHDPIDIMYELKNAFQFGRGEAQIEKVRKSTSGIWHQIALSYFNRGAIEYYQSAKENYGLDTALFLAFWRMLYLSGYEYESSNRQG